jgi:hypothetical protein
MAVAMLMSLRGRGAGAAGPKVQALPLSGSRLVHELLIGPIYYRLLFSGPPFDRNLGARLVDAVLDGFGVPQARRAAGEAVADSGTPRLARRLAMPWLG